MTTTEPEYTPGEVDNLLASRWYERSLNEYGIEYEAATDPANKGRFIPERTIDFSVAAVEGAQAEFREKYGHDKQFGSRWSVRLPPDES